MNGQLFTTFGKKFTKKSFTPIESLWRVHTKDSILINKNYLNDFYKRKIIIPSKFYARWPEKVKKEAKTLKLNYITKICPNSNDVKNSILEISDDY